jgi:trehalose 6-phosphate synthase/phosphatase
MVFFRYKSNIQVPPNHHVVVVGDAEELGMGDSTRGHVLRTRDDCAPAWFSPDPVSMPVNVPVTYWYQHEPNIAPSSSITQTTSAESVNSAPALESGKKGSSHKLGEAPSLSFPQLKEGGAKKPSRGDQRRYVVVPTGPEMTVEDDGGFLRKSTQDAEENDQEDKLKKILSRRDEEQVAERLVPEYEEPVFSPQDTLALVTVQLPVKLRRNADAGGEWEIEVALPDSGVVGSIWNKGKKRPGWPRVLCVGWPGLYLNDHAEEQRVTDLLWQYGCAPVWVRQDEFEGFLNFANDFLTPVFHDVMHWHRDLLLHGKRPFNDKGWEAYQRVNNKFADVVLRHTTGTQNDMFWFNGVYLLLAGQNIVRRCELANTGLVLHAPFPTYGTFENLPIRQELMHAMVCFDMVQFQFFQDCKNFITAAKRLLEAEIKPTGWGKQAIEYCGREIYLRVSHVAVTEQIVLTKDAAEELQAKIAEVREKYKGKYVITSRDPLDSQLSGLAMKIAAFHALLRKYPELPSRCVLVMHAVGNTRGLSSEGKDRYAALVGMVEELCTVHNAECVRLEVMPGSSLEGQALLAVADAYFDTSYKQGFNLGPYHYLQAQQAQLSAAGDENLVPGTVVLSEFSGCSKVLRGALVINPMDVEGVAKTLLRIFEMTRAERRERFEEGINVVMASDLETWAKDFMIDLREARKDASKVFTAYGLGATFRLIAMERSFRPLQKDLVSRAMKTSVNRVFLLDFEGTIREAARTLQSRRVTSVTKSDVGELGIELTPPSKSVLQTLVCLCEDTRNTVVIMSGRSSTSLEKAFEGVPGIGLVAEHGFYHKLPSLSGDQWCAMSQTDTEWKTIAFKLMQEYCKRVQGSFIEYKGSAMTWIYREANMEFGAMQGSELAEALEDTTSGFPLRIIHWSGYVEVRVEGVNKGTAVQTVLERVIRIKGVPDFVLCMGDERSDEPMFEALAEKMTEMDIPEEDVHEDDAQPDFGGFGSLNRSQTGAALPSMPVLSTKISKYQSFANIQTSFGGGLKHRAASLGGALSSLGSAGARPAPEPKKKAPMWCSCTVGRKPSKAQYYLDDVAAVTDMLRLCMVSSIDSAQLANFEKNSMSMPARIGGAKGPRVKKTALTEVFFDEPDIGPSSPFFDDQNGFVECVREDDDDYYSD